MTSALDRRLRALEPARTSASRPTLVITLCGHDDARIASIGDAALCRHDGEAYAGFVGRAEALARESAGARLVLISDAGTASIQDHRA